MGMWMWADGLSEYDLFIDTSKAVRFSSGNDKNDAIYRE